MSVPRYSLSTFMNAHRPDSSSCCRCWRRLRRAGARRRRPVARAERPNVLLVTIDTLRADHLGCYGRQVADTPTAGWAGEARCAVRDRHRARASHRSVTRVDSERAQPARARVPQQQRVRARPHREHGRRGFPPGRLSDGRVRLRIPARPPLRIRSRVRGVRRPPATGKRSAADPVRGAERGRHDARGSRLAGSFQVPLPEGGTRGFCGSTTTTRMRLTSRQPRTWLSASRRRPTTEKLRSSTASWAACCRRSGNGRRWIAPSCSSRRIMARASVSTARRRTASSSTTRRSACPG